mmetsp:Transcript_44610/g.112906  ORF Transcript_44610/g.112906 Transcript_44610/m.112906 type:complete len:209 (-) Transcript_44610:795-1421(-)
MIAPATAMALLRDLNSQSCMPPSKTSLPRRRVNTLPSRRMGTCAEAMLTLMRSFRQENLPIGICRQKGSSVTRSFTRSRHMSAASCGKVSCSQSRTSLPHTPTTPSGLSSNFLSSASFIADCSACSAETPQAVSVAAMAPLEAPKKLVLDRSYRSRRNLTTPSCHQKYTPPPQKLRTGVSYSRPEGGAVEDSSEVCQQVDKFRSSRAR